MINKNVNSFSCSSDSVSASPDRKVPAKASKISDRQQQLKAYRLNKNTQKLKQIQEQRSPFIVAVPSGRWVEKKEKVVFRFGLNDTPVKAALMSERVLKKSTVKKLIQNSTVKKENAAPFTKLSNKPLAVKSKKKILGELNAVVSSEIESPLMSPVESDLNTTFEISPIEGDSIDNPHSIRRSNSLPERKPEKPDMALKPLTPSPEPIVKRKVPIVESKDFKLAKKASTNISKVSKQAKLKPTKAVIIKPIVPKKVVPKKVEKEEEIDPCESQDEIECESPKAKSPERSRTFNIHTVSMKIQIDYLEMQMDDILSQKEKFFSLITEEQQMFVNQTIRQTNLIISDKMSKFKEFLMKFESEHDQVDPSKRLTEEDVENYWYLIYDEIVIIKKNLDKVLNMKSIAFTAATPGKKRRTRRTFIPEDGTPKRSKRLAENVETPK
jgi:hypothetical protein